MYNLHLSPEQLEIRDTVRDFVAQEIKPVALDAEPSRRLRPAAARSTCSTRPRRWGCARSRFRRSSAAPAPTRLTCCIVTEELAVGDADIAAVLAQTSTLGGVLFARMTTEQRDRFLPRVPGGRPLSSGVRASTSPTPIRRSA